MSAVFPSNVKVPWTPLLTSHSTSDIGPQNTLVYKPLPAWVIGEEVQLIHASE